MSDATMARIEALGLRLPDIGASAGDYVHAREVDGILYLAGKGPLSLDGQLARGRIGAEFTTQEGHALSRLTGLSLIAAMSGHLDGALDRVAAIGKVTGFVCAVDGWGEHPKVIDGCSELMTEVFGERGRHARSAIGVHTLPFGIPIEIEAVVHLSR